MVWVFSLISVFTVPKWRIRLHFSLGCGNIWFPSGHESRETTDTLHFSKRVPTGIKVWCKNVGRTLRQNFSCCLQLVLLPGSADTGRTFRKIGELIWLSICIVRIGTRKICSIFRFFFSAKKHIHLLYRSLGTEVELAVPFQENLREATLSWNSPGSSILGLKSSLGENVRFS